MSEPLHSLSRLLRHLTGLIPACLLCVSLTATDVGGQEAEDRPRIGLTLAGGGARGAAHVGVLEVLEEMRIPVDYVVGTSMGSIVGGFYAAGMTPAEMEDVIVDVDWIDLFNDTPPRQDIPFRRKEEDRAALFRMEIGIGVSAVSLPAGLIAGQKLSFLLRSLTSRVYDIQDFDDLCVSYRSVATDLVSADIVVLDHGNLADAMRASMAIPGVFNPVDIEGQRLVDGGAILNLPVSVTRDLGADIIIAVDVGTPLEQMDAHQPQGLFGIASRTIDVLTKRSTAEQRALLTGRDVLIVPELEGIKSGSFHLMAEASARGREAAHLVRAQLATLSVSPEEYAHHLEQRRSRLQENRPPMTIAEVRLEGLTRVHPSLVRRRIRTMPGGPLDADVLREDLANVYRIGEFEQVDFRVEGRGRERDVVFRMTEKSWGPSFLRMGLALESNLDADSDFTLATYFRRASLNRYGAEWRTILEVGDIQAIETELYQPIGYSGGFFVAPKLVFRQDTDQTTIEGSRVLVSGWRRQGSLDVGLQLGDDLQLRAGILAGRINAETKIGGDLDVDANLGAWAFSVDFDRQDNAWFPRSGSRITADLVFSRPELGADDHYDRLTANVTSSRSLGANTVFGAVGFGTDLDSDLPIYDKLRLGGFGRLSGFSRNELQDDALLLLSLGAFRQIGELPPLIGRGMYIGGQMEFGEIWEQDADIGLTDLRPGGLLFFGVETALGPMYLGYGRSGDVSDAWYFFLGPVLRR